MLTKVKLLPLLIVLSVSFSCAVPRVVILKDPLTAEEHVDLGYIYERQGKLDLAEEEYKRAVKKNRRLWQAYFNLGNVYAQRWEFERAEEAYRKALELSPQNPDILNNLAYVLYKQGRKEEGLVYIRKALQIKDKPEYRQTLKALESKW